MLSQPFDLVLSSGFLCFSSHAGFLRALEATGQAPSAYVGTSSGSLAAAFSAAGLSADEVKQELGGQRPISLVRPSSRPWAGPISSRALVAKLRTVLPQTFEELEVPLAVGVYATTRGSKDKVPMLVTSGALPEAVAASCAVPGIFRPLRLSDGGGVAIGSDGALYELAEDEGKSSHLHRSYADGGAIDRTMCSAWAHWRPERSALVHLVSALPEGEFGPRDGVPSISSSISSIGGIGVGGGRGGDGGGGCDSATAASIAGIVRTPRAKASFFSLQDYDAQVDAAAAAAQGQLERLFTLRGGWGGSQSSAAVDGGVTAAATSGCAPTTRRAALASSAAASAVFAIPDALPLAALSAGIAPFSPHSSAHASDATAASTIGTQVGSQPDAPGFELGVPDGFVTVSRSGRVGSNFLLGECYQRNAPLGFP